MVDAKQRRMEMQAAKNILLVDDQQTFLTALAEGLQACNDECCILTAENGERAVKVLESARVDLVITDLKMPVMDGFGLISHMKEKYPRIPVIVISYFLYPELESKLQTLGVSQILDKSELSFGNLTGMIAESWQNVA
jgi:DNA-binding NarL/FixJ family response regulator